jgi:hypothetical protein
VVGVLPDDLLESVAVRVLRTFFVEVKEDGGSGAGAFGRFDLEPGLAVGDTPSSGTRINNTLSAHMFTFNLMNDS